jgi:hypothetical protein
MSTKRPNQAFYVWLVDLHAIFPKYELETWFSPNDDIFNIWSSCSVAELKKRLVPEWQEMT